MVSIAIVHFTSLYLQRPVGVLSVMLSIILAQLTSSPVGLEWIAPIFMIKLLLSHGIKEDPYRRALEE